jgi:hypothetical protein
MKTAAEIVSEILADLRGRGGLDGAWDSIDSDIQQEIRETWEGIVTAGM